MAVRRSSGGAEVVLPAGYVAQHVELAYATTAFRIQGRTVDTAHAMVSPTTTREVLYVAATRGRESNRLYVDVAYRPDPATGHDGAVDAADRARRARRRARQRGRGASPLTKLSNVLSGRRTTSPLSPPSTRRSPASLKNDVRTIPRSPPTDECVIGPKRPARGDGPEAASSQD